MIKTDFRTEALLDLTKTVAAALFAEAEYPWEIIPEISDFILRLGEALPVEKYDLIAPKVWAAKSAVIAPTAHITGPCIVDEQAEVRHCAFIRGNAIVGKGAVVGNSSEVKNAILFDEAQAPHFNYVGDSVVGYRSHIGAGVILSNLKSDKTPVTVRLEDGERLATGLKKFGAVIGDDTEVGCNSVLGPGAVLGRNATVYPLSHIRGALAANCIYKDKGNIIIKK